MMRLAVNGRFYAADVTGVQRFAREVTTRLCRRTDVTLLLPRGVAAPADAGAAAALRGRLRGHPFEQLEVPALATRAAADATLHMSGTLPLQGGPHIVVVHDVLPLTHPEWFSWRFARWYRFVLMRAVPHAAAVVTVSEWAKQEIVRTLGAPATRVHVVLQGIEPFADPAAPAETERVRDSLALPDPYVLVVGGGDARKNVAFAGRVLDAWDRRAGSPPHIVIVGGVARRVHGRVPRRVHGAQYVGRVSDAELRALYTAATVVLCPSKAEGFGRTPLEAAACGTPSIVATHPAAMEAIGNGAEILPLEPVEWARALHRLLDDGDQRAQLVSRARDRVAAMSWDTCAQQVLETCTAAVHAPTAVRAAHAPAEAAD